LARIANNNPKVTDGNTKKKRLTGDELLREQHPGLKELWDQYQTMLKLVTPSIEKESTLKKLKRTFKG